MVASFLARYREYALLERVAVHRDRTQCCAHAYVYGVKLELPCADI